jgi:hypothetical protein
MINFKITMFKYNNFGKKQSYYAKQLDSSSVIRPINYNEM